MQQQQGIKHRIGTFLTASRALDAWVASTAQGRPERIVSRQADHQPLEMGVVEKTVEAMLEDGSRTQLQVLLGTIGRHSGTDARGRYHGPEIRQWRNHWANW
ncbi:hypothetical protein D3C81_1898660 [compost metagenome]